MTRTIPASPAGLRRLLPAALFAAAVAFASTTLGYPAIASAERVWDVKEYDRCVADKTNPGDNLDEILGAEQLCCWISGGDWNDNQYKCQAPPAQGAGTDTSTPPPPKAGIPTAPVQPPTVGSPTTLILPTVPVQPLMVG
jgi:hypothetical protein